MVMKKGAIRIEIDTNFKGTKENPMVVKPNTDSGISWSIFKEDKSVVVEKDGTEMYRWEFNGSLFIMGDEYCYYRHKGFQTLLDAFRIDKVIKVNPDKEPKVDVVCGVKELDKSFSIYSDGMVEIKKAADIRVGEPHQTKRFTIVFHNATWAIVDTKNTRHSYRTMYCWDESPHIKLMELNKSGIGLPKFSSK